MKQDIFADNISAIHVTGNMVRIDFSTLQPQLKNENGQPVFHVSNRIVMPLEGFVQALSVQEALVKQLLESGILKNDQPSEVLDSE